MIAFAELLHNGTGKSSRALERVCELLERVMKNLAVVALALISPVFLGNCGNVVRPVQGPPPLDISPASAPSATVGFAYNLPLNATGGQSPYVWSVSAGALPSGITLDASSGVLSGVPTMTGTSNFTVQAADSSMPARTGTMPFTLVVNGQLAFSITSLPDAAVSVPYSTTASVAGGSAPYTWSIASGSLPPGLSLNSATGVISGAPTTAGGYGLGLKVTDSSNPQQTAKFFSGINVNPQLTITSTSLPDGVVGTSYSATLTASGGTGSYTWSISSGNLPDGINLDPGTGTLSGTPTSAGQANFTVQVTDTANPPQNPTLPLSLNVTAEGANDRLMKGSYAFLLQGFDSNGAVAFAGTMDSDGAGSITGGVLDINRSGGAQENVVIESGQFAINSDNRGSVTIRSALGNQTFSVAINVDGTLVHFIEFDAAGPNVIRGNGIMKKRIADGLAQPKWTGQYAFSLTGSTATGHRSAMLGSFTADLAGLIAAGLADSNSDGIVVQETSIEDTSGYSFAESGRGALKLVIDGVGSVTGTTYFVSPKESFFVRMDGPGNDLLSGEILQQSGNPFLGPAFPKSGVLHVEGESSTGSTIVGVGLVSTEGPSNLFGRYDADDTGQVTSKSVANGSHAITSSDFGRGTMAFADNDLVFYLVDSATALVMDKTGREVKTGVFEGQSAAASSLLIPEGSFAMGSENNVQSGVAFGSGVLNIASPGRIFGTVDANSPGNVLSSGYALNGRLVSPSEGRIKTTEGTIYYVVSATRIIEADMQPGQTSPRLVILDQ